MKQPSWSIPLLLYTSSKIFITRTTRRQTKNVQTRGNYKNFWIRVLHTLGLGKHLWVLLEARKTEIKTTSSLLTLYVRGSARDKVTLHRPIDPCISVLTKQIKKTLSQDKGELYQVIFTQIYDRSQRTVSNIPSLASTKTTQGTVRVILKQLPNKFKMC